jgi:hypothetical protein
VGFVEGLPEEFVVVPVGAAGEDHHRAGGRVVFAALGCAGGEEVAGVDLTGGQAGGTRVPFTVENGRPVSTR